MFLPWSPVIRQNMPHTISPLYLRICNQGDNTFLSHIQTTALSSHASIPQQHPGVRLIRLFDLHWCDLKWPPGADLIHSSWTLFHFSFPTESMSATSILFSHRAFFSYFLASCIKAKLTTIYKFSREIINIIVRIVLIFNALFNFFTGDVVKNRVGLFTSLVLGELAGSRSVVIVEDLFYLSDNLVLALNSIQPTSPNVRGS